MDINDMVDGIMKSINQFADKIAEQQLQKKMQQTGRGSKVRKEYGEFSAKREAGHDGFPETTMIGPVVPTPRKRHSNTG